MTIRTHLSLSRASTLNVLLMIGFTFGSLQMLSAGNRLKKSQSEIAREAKGKVLKSRQKANDARKRPKNEMKDRLQSVRQQTSRKVSLKERKLRAAQESQSLASERYVNTLNKFVEEGRSIPEHAKKRGSWSLYQGQRVLSVLGKKVPLEKKQAHLALKKARLERKRLLQDSRRFERELQKSKGVKANAETNLEQAKRENTKEEIRNRTAESLRQSRRERVAKAEEILNEGRRLAWSTVKDWAEESRVDYKELIDGLSMNSAIQSTAAKSRVDSHDLIQQSESAVRYIAKTTDALDEVIQNEGPWQRAERELNALERPHRMAENDYNQANSEFEAVDRQLKKIERELRSSRYSDIDTNYSTQMPSSGNHGYDDAPMEYQRHKDRIEKNRRKNKENKNLRAERQELRRKIDSIQTRWDQSKRTLDTAETEFRTLSRKKKRLNNVIDEYIDDENTASNRVSELDSKLSFLVDRSMQNKKRNNTLRGTLDAMNDFTAQASEETIARLEPFTTQLALRDTVLSANMRTSTYQTMTSQDASNAIGRLRTTTRDLEQWRSHLVNNRTEIKKIEAELNRRVQVMEQEVLEIKREIMATE